MHGATEFGRCQWVLTGRPRPWPPEFPGDQSRNQERCQWAAGSAAGGRGSLGLPAAEWACRSESASVSPASNSLTPSPTRLSWTAPEPRPSELLVSSPGPAPGPEPAWSSGCPDDPARAAAPRPAPGRARRARVMITPGTVDSTSSHYPDGRRL
jgi:hypothetical protein